ncbi:hypothetical protein [Vibrio campbellii]|uniref:hypothetical protein n=2 Tax=Vibrio campbellii TaxID=680 RepID=UPI0005EDCF66|nr:hypothetical protein [Vibrio campbellii]
MSEEASNITFYKSLFSLSLFISKIKPEKVYCRDVYSFYVLFITRLIRRHRYEIYTDLRALSFEELKFKRRNWLKVRFMKSLEKFMVHQSESLSVVSFNLKKHVVDNLKWNPKSISVFPCTYDFEPIKRVDYKKNDQISFVYVGGLSSWQKFDVILEFISKYHEIDMNIHFMVLTGDVCKAESYLFERFGSMPDFIKIKSVPQSKIKQEIASYHYGIVFRDDVIMNQVASPIKVGEYLGAGVVPILSAGVGDYSRFILKNNLGYQINMNEIDNAILEIKSNYDQGKYYEMHENIIKINHTFNFSFNINEHFFVKSR